MTAFPRADGAARALHAALDDRIVGVSSRAPPPDLLMASEGNVGRGQVAVFLSVPFAQQFVAAAFGTELAQAFPHSYDHTFPLRYKAPKGMKPSTLNTASRNLLEYT